MQRLNNWVPLSNCRNLPNLCGIYVIRNKLDGKEYVGQSVRVRDRLVSHLRKVYPNKYLYRAMTVHGLAAFECCLLSTETVETLDSAEVQAVLSRRTLSPAGYNLTYGGGGSRGFVPSEESRQKMREAQLGRIHPEETKELMRRARYANNHQKGVKLSEERKRAIKEFTVRHHTGLKRSEQARENISKGRTGIGLGREISAEVRAKIAAGHLGVPKPGSAQHGEKNPMYGKPSALRREVLLWEGNSMLPRLFVSVSHAAEHLGVKPASICDWCVGRYRPKGLLAICYAD